MRVLSCLALLTGIASADPVKVEVTEVAGDTAYLSPGRAAGIVPGTVLVVAGHEVTVVEVTEKTAVVRLAGGWRPAIGATGTATITADAAATVKTLPKPRPPEAFVGQWPAPVLPADSQTPEVVPLGSTRATTGRAHVLVTGHGFAAADRSNRVASGEGRVVASFEPMTERPLGIDVDVAGRWYSDGANKQTRTPLFVRTAQVRYGDARDPQVALGRLRYAASALGMLDGARAALHRGDLEVAAFGGIVPDPLSGKPDTSASRFGGELVYDLAASAWQPRVAVTAYGSTWKGALDERRLSAVVSANHGATWLDGWAELQNFGSDNPWGAGSIELTGAGASATWREHGRHLGVDLTFLRPERSLRLAAALPPEWLCTVTAAPGTSDNTCSGGDYWAAASGSAGVRTSRFAVDAIGSIGESHGVYRGIDSSGYVRGELFLGSWRLLAGAAGNYATFVQSISGELGVGYTPTRRLDGAIRYRPELVNYSASTGAIQLHSIVADGHYAMSSALDLGLSMIGTTGPDRDGLAVLALVSWRPLP
jgi:hypothetical protein